MHSISERKRPPEWTKFLQTEIPTGNLSPTHPDNSYSAMLKNKQSNKKKSAKNVNAHFSEEGIDMAIKHKNRCLASLVLRERRINFLIRYHLTSVRMTISKTL